MFVGSPVKSSHPLASLAICAWINFFCASVIVSVPPGPAGGLFGSPFQLLTALGLGQVQFPPDAGLQYGVQSQPSQMLSCTLSARLLMLRDWSAHCSHGHAVSSTSPRRNACRCTWNV